MAVKRIRHSREHGGYIILLLVLCCILVLAVGLISRNKGKETDSAAEGTDPLSSEPADSTATQPAAQNSNADAQASSPVPSSDGTVTNAYSFHAELSHLYIRINRDKSVPLTADSADVNLDDIVWSISDETIAVVDETGLVTGLQQGSCTLYADYGVEQLEIPVTVRELSVVDGCTYVDGILVANKSYSLPESYDPGLLPETEDAFASLKADAAAQGLDIYLGSGYRDYAFQVECYNSIVEAYGKEYADEFSARPGFSEHQTGYTIDCNTIDDAFGETEEGKWLAEHCWEYGFIIRYPEGKEAITGYAYESWHIRYVGVEAAREIWEQGLTLEEYLDVDSVYAE